METANTWQSRSLQDLNQAVVAGMVDALRPAATVGVYSTHYQWNKIMGSLGAYTTSDLTPLDEWVPTGLGSASVSDCTNSSYPQITTGGGPIDFIQYTATYDYDVACQNPTSL